MQSSTSRLHYALHIVRPSVRPVPIVNWKIIKRSNLEERSRVTGRSIFMSKSRRSRSQGRKCDDQFWSISLRKLYRFRYSCTLVSKPTMTHCTLHVTSNNAAACGRLSWLSVSFVLYVKYTYVKCTLIHLLSLFLARQPSPP